MRVVLFQPPVFRREAPATALAKALAVPRIHAGDLIRAHISRSTELGVRAAEAIDSGALFPDEIITEIVRDRLHQWAHAGFLLVGHPLSAARALALDELLGELGKPLDSVLHLRLPEEEMERHVRRLAGRRFCREDQSHIFELSVDHLLIDGFCNVCGGELHQRGEDNENSIRSRVRSHEAMLEPITQHYARQDLLVTVDAVGAPDEIAGRALTALRDRGPRPCSGRLRA
ncbi:adenylate kinase family protein [Kitasatospora sp. NPDC057738]|uniref:adenylate kinase family protein n=1 Tax=Kitasatospora sp. NPDC057738 TaxID=3346233 RepID=UPI0036CBDD22